MIKGTIILEPRRIFVATVESLDGQTETINKDEGMVYGVPRRSTECILG